MVVIDSKKNKDDDDDNEKEEKDDDDVDDYDHDHDWSWWCLPSRSYLFYFTGDITKWVSYVVCYDAYNTGQHYSLM